MKRSTQRLNRIATLRQRIAFDAARLARMRGNDADSDASASCDEDGNARYFICTKCSQSLARANFSASRLANHHYTCSKCVYQHYQKPRVAAPHSRLLKNLRQTERRKGANISTLTAQSLLATLERTNTSPETVKCIRRARESDPFDWLTNCKLRLKRPQRPLLR